MTIKSELRQLHIVLQQNATAISRNKSVSVLAAFAGVMGITPQEIKIYEVDEQKRAFNLGVSAAAVGQLRSGLRANKGQLRLMGVESITLESEAGQFETWRINNGVFEAGTPINRHAVETSLNTFAPIPGIWRFHLTYLLVTAVMGLAAFPYSQFVSLLLISGVCGFGIILTFSKQLMAAHILALAIGLGSPVVVLAGLLPAQTVILFLFLIFGATLARKFLF